MRLNLFNSKKSFFKKLIISFTLFSFFLSMALPPQYVSAQTIFSLPNPGGMIHLSPGFQPPVIRGMKIFPDNPLRLDFIISPGEVKRAPEELKDESSKLIKYFLATLTVPEEDLWVNLSPYEKDRIIPDEFGQTEMGRDLLAQDYILKQLTASLIYPDDNLGKEFWAKVYQKAYEIYGTTEIPMNTFNKVWIVPDKAVVYENGDTVMILESHLKVMLESDYLALKENLNNQKLGLDKVSDSDAQQLNDVSSQMVKTIILPAIEKEVNEGKNFASLRQIYQSMILAAWFRNNLKKNILNQVYTGQNKIAGVDVDDKEIKEKIYQKYLEAFKVGVYNLVKEEYDPGTQEIIPRKYFSGGFIGRDLYRATSIVRPNTITPAQKIQEHDAVDGALVAQVQLNPATSIKKSPDRAVLGAQKYFRDRAMLVEPVIKPETRVKGDQLTVVFASKQGNPVERTLKIVSEIDLDQAKRTEITQLSPQYSALINAFLNMMLQARIYNFETTPETPVSDFSFGTQTPSIALSQDLGTNAMAIFERMVEFWNTQGNVTFTLSQNDRLMINLSEEIATRGQSFSVPLSKEAKPWAQAAQSQGAYGDHQMIKVLMSSLFGDRFTQLEQQRQSAIKDMRQMENVVYHRLTFPEDIIDQVRGEVTKAVSDLFSPTRTSPQYTWPSVEGALADTVLIEELSKRRKSFTAAHGDLKEEHDLGVIETAPTLEELAEVLKEGREYGLQILESDGANTLVMTKGNERGESAWTGDRRLITPFVFNKENAPVIVELHSHPRDTPPSHEDGDGAEKNRATALRKGRQPTRDFVTRLDPDQNVWKLYEYNETTRQWDLMEGREQVGQKLLEAGLIRSYRPDAAMTAQKVWQDFEKNEGYRLDIKEKSGRGVEGLEVNVFNKAGRMINPEAIKILIYPNQKVIVIDRFYPGFPVPLSEEEKVGRGRALLRHLIDPDKYGGFRVISFASPELRKSFLKMTDFSPQIEDYSLNMPALSGDMDRFPEYKKFYSEMMDVFNDPHDGLDKNGLDILQARLASATLFGIVPSKRQKTLEPPVMAKPSVTSGQAQPDAAMTAEQDSHAAKRLKRERIHQGTLDALQWLSREHDISPIEHSYETDSSWLTRLIQFRGINKNAIVIGQLDKRAISDEAARAISDFSKNPSFPDADKIGFYFRNRLAPYQGSERREMVAVILYEDERLNTVENLKDLSRRIAKWVVDNRVKFSVPYWERDESPVASAQSSDKDKAMTAQKQSPVARNLSLATNEQPATSNQPRDVGGIDMNPSMLDLKTKGQSVDMNVLFDPSSLENINGLTPIIIQIVPIANTPLLLGISRDTPGVPQLSSAQ